MRYKSMKCIGIISFFPDNIRVERRQRLKKLLTQLNTYFKLPVIIIAQNWVKEDFEIFGGLNNQKFFVHTYPKLGIAKARITLREKFLESDYDWLIMFDDDMEIKEDQALVDKWLGQISDKDFYYTPTFLTNFCAISKEGMKKVFYNDLDPAKGMGFEDWVFVERCLHDLKCETFNVTLPALTRQGFLNDSLSTWDPHNLMLKRINEGSSRKIIYKIREGKDNKYILTIVLPVYNSAEFILKALNSLPKREDVEYIIIDDCSTDNSYEVCETWVKENSNLICKLLKNEENKGVGFTKNKGYSMAQGEYIVTVDSDDWCNTPEYNAAIDALYRLDQDRIIFPVIYNDGHISDGTVRTATWGQFLKNDFLKKNNLNFNPEHRRAEDWFLRMEYEKIPHTEVRMQGITPYHYNENREGSITWEWNKNGKQD